MLKNKNNNKNKFGSALHTYKYERFLNVSPKYLLTL